MPINFEALLTYAVLITGVICLFDKVFLMRRRLATASNMPKIIEYSRSFFPVLFAVWLIRSFLFEPFRIPSGSLKPTLQVGDFILVNKYSYGLRLPVLHSLLYKMSEPKVGDIAVFRFPLEPQVDLIKRVVGIPGDHISYINKVLYRNGNPVPQQAIGMTTETDQYGVDWPVALLNENLDGIQHGIFIRPSAPVLDIKDIIIPPGHYFMMGDNRDNSNDSRYWGFVAESDLVGKALRVWFSWDKKTKAIRWQRLGLAIN